MRRHKLNILTSFNFISGQKVNFYTSKKLLTLLIAGRKPFTVQSWKFPLKLRFLSSHSVLAVRAIMKFCGASSGHRPPLGSLLAVIFTQKTKVRVSSHSDELPPTNISFVPYCVTLSQLYTIYFSHRGWH